MSRGAIAKAVSTLLEASGQDEDRFVEMTLSLRLCQVDPVTRAWLPSTDEEIARVGGVWDRRAKDYAPRRHARLMIVRLHRGQEKAARWFADWLSRAAKGPRGPHWEGFRRVWSALFIGGRRGGKSHMACVALVVFAAMMPAARVWAISPTQEETDELEQAIRSLLPGDWYTYRGGGGGKPLQFKLANGARIMCLSGNKPRSLKRGRVDFCLYNEAQNMFRKGWIQLRGAIADTGGLCILAANPPDSEIGRWIEPVYEMAIAKKNLVEVFAMSAMDNPFVEQQALLDMQADLQDEVTYRREVLGEFTPIGDIVMHAWSDSETVIDAVPAGFVDITAEFTQQVLGRAFGYVVGMDFQRLPHMAATVFKFFRDPNGPPNEAIAIVVDECVVEDADEDDLLDVLEAKPRWTRDGVDRGGYRGWRESEDSDVTPALCCVVADASGWFQDGAHTLGKTSDRKLMARKWTFLYKPQADSDRNPAIDERVKSGNAVLKSAAGRRRMFSLRGNLNTNRAMRSWENKGGVPYRRSPFAHVCDAATYVIYRFYGRPKLAKKAGEYKSVKRFNRAEQMRGL